MHEMTVQELIDFLTGLPEEYKSKKVMMDPQAPVGMLTDITVSPDEPAILLKGGDDNARYRVSGNLPAGKIEACSFLNTTPDELAKSLKCGFEEIIKQADEWRPLASHVLELVGMALTRNKP